MIRSKQAEHLTYNVRKFKKTIQKRLLKAEEEELLSKKKTWQNGLIYKTFVAEYTMYTVQVQTATFAAAFVREQLLAYGSDRGNCAPFVSFKTGNDPANRVVI